MKKVLSMLLVMACSLLAEAAVTWDFSTDPEGAGDWVDSSSYTWNWYSGSQYIGCQSVRRNYLEAYYMPLEQTFTQDDSFSATYDINMEGINKS